MTAVLAEIVGPSGRVAAVDIASRDYGAPMSVGEATDLIKASALGQRTDFRFEFDVFSQEFPPDFFDYTVLAHSAWYFESSDHLLRTFQRLAQWAPKLCFAEWDIEPKGIDQLPHMLAVLTQGQVEAFKGQSQANIRTPLTLATMKGLLSDAGWTVQPETWVDAGGMQDADWEISACLSSSFEEATSLGLPAKYLSLLREQIEMLRSIAKPKGNTSLPCYSIVAERSPGTI